MKIIHCGDIHIGSSSNGVASAKDRRHELIQSFARMVEYAHNNEVGAVIIAGDLFDNDIVSSMEIRDIVNIITRYDILYYILQGNHGGNAPYQALEECGNVYMFGNQWTSYNVQDVVITGIETATADSYECLQLDNSMYNIVVLHGDVSNNNYGVIDPKRLFGLGARYIALGHRHSYHIVGSAKGSSAVYCGVLETRGFDERNDSGFVVIDTDTNTHEYVQQHIRRVDSYTIDITGLDSNIMVENTLLDALSTANQRNYINIELVGVLNKNVSLDIIRQIFAKRYFALRIDNKTTVDIDYESIRQEHSLRSEVITICDDITDSKQKNDVIRLAIQSLSGEDIVW